MNTASTSSTSIPRAATSVNDVAATKQEKIFRQVEQLIQDEDLTSMIQLIQDRVNESDYTAMDLAAAFLKLITNTEDTAQDEDPSQLLNTGAEEEGMVRLFINAGKKQNIRPGDIVGAIAGESGMPGKLIGSIDMYDKYTFVEVPREYAMDVLHAMDHAKIKGRSINIEPANQK